MEWVGPKIVSKGQEVSRAQVLQFMTAWKVSKYGVFSVPNAGKYKPEKTQ